VLIRVELVLFEASVETFEIIVVPFKGVMIVSFNMVVVEFNIVEIVLLIAIVVLFNGDVILPTVDEEALLSVPVKLSRTNVVLLPRARLVSFNTVAVLLITVPVSLTAPTIKLSTVELDPPSTPEIVPLIKLVVLLTTPDAVSLIRVVVSLTVALV